MFGQGITTTEEVDCVTNSNVDTFEIPLTTDFQRAEEARTRFEVFDRFRSQ
jgi:hypothetical protein